MFFNAKSKEVNQHKDDTETVENDDDSEEEEIGGSTENNEVEEEDESTNEDDADDDVEETNVGERTTRSGRVVRSTTRLIEEMDATAIDEIMAVGAGIGSGFADTNKLHTQTYGSYERTQGATLG